MKMQNSIKSPSVIIRIFRDFTLAKKLTILFSLLFAAVSASLFVSLPARFEEQALHAMNGKASSIIEITSYSVGPAFMFEDTISFRETIESVRQDSQIVYVVFVGSNNRILASYQNQVAENENFRSAKMGNHISVDGLHLLTYTEVRAHDRPIGDLYMGFSLSSLRDEVASTRASIAVVSILLFIFGVFSVMWISVIVTRPLAHMVTTVESITGGDYSKRATVVSKDELGHLAVSFNLMIDRLHSLNKNLETSNEELEARVKLRTADLQREVLDHQLSEEALQESELRFRRLFIASPDAIILLDSSDPSGYWPIVDCNDIACQMNGYMREELIGKSVDILNISVGTPEEHVAYLDRVRREGVMRFETFHRHRDGHIFPIEVSTSIVIFKGHELILGIDRDITERKRVEEALRDSEARMKDIIYSMGDWVWEVDENGRFIYSSKKGKDLFLCAQEDIMGKTPFDFMPPEEAERVRTIFSEIVSNKTPIIDLENWNIRKDGERICLLTNGVPVLDENGNLRGYRGVNKDITERKRAEEALRETRDYLENLLSFANAPIMVWDSNYRITRFNLAFERLAGYTMYDVIGKHPAMLFLTDYRETVLSLLTRTSGGEHLVSVEVPIRCKNGDVRVVLWNTANIYAIDEKTITATIAHGQDITVRKRAEEALQESELRFRSLYENATIGIYRTTPDGTILLANPALSKMLGYTSFQELAERNLEKDGFEPSSQRKEFLKKIERDGEVIGHESKWIRQDGTIIFVLDSARAIRDSQGKTLYYDGTVEDITKRKLLEEQMRQMQKLEGLGTLAGGIAHDFNNILGIILAYITSTKHFKDDTKKLDLAIDTIVKAVDRGKTLVQQILTFARRTETEFGPVDVNDVVREIITMILETFPRILTYSQNLDKDIQFIHADRSQLHQALLNLCVNARDAMPNGGVLTINTRLMSSISLRDQHPDVAAGGYICIEVSDTGEGMTSETQKRIFEPFFTTKGIGKGTGLGLAVVFGVVQTHKGFIDVDSEIGKGTTFHLYLPALQAAEPIIVEDEETLEEIPGGTETLLVVEDEEMLMMSLRMVLVEKGYTVISGGDGSDAVNIYKEQKKDIALVLTDLGLPKMSGMEECAQIKKLDPKARMIIATGYLAPGMKSEFLKAGVQHFLYKPYDLKKVLKVIREVLDEK